jgi:ribosomal protein S18 acetylase RimI-like enzyme
MNISSEPFRFEELETLPSSAYEQVLGKFWCDESIPARRVAERRLERIAQSHGIHIAARDRGELVALVCVSESEWDSHHFGIQIGKLECAIISPGLKTEAILGLVEAVKLQANKSGIRLIFARLPLVNLRVIQAFQTTGAKLTDVLLTMRRCGRNTAVHGRDHTISLAVSKDLPWLRSIAKRAFRLDHFHADDSLDYDKSSEVYSEWIATSYSRETSGRIFVARDSKSRPIGFVVCRIDGVVPGTDVGAIDLIGVEPDRMGKGIGSALMCTAIQFFSSRVQSVYVGTQAANAAAIRLYENSGFRNVLTEATLHMRT